MRSEIYVVVAEHKLEGPLVAETSVEKASYENARKRMDQLASDPRIIRLALGRVVYAEGHEDLIPKEENSEPASR